MSLQVKLEEDDRQFIKQAKSWWSEIKKQMLFISIAKIGRANV